jgi:hypothetical protein
MLEPKFLLSIIICHSVIVTATTAKARLKLKILENEFQSISDEFNRVETQLSEHRTLCIEQYVNDLHKSDWTVREGAPRIPEPNDGALL